jgi:hypothetical protein
LGFDCLGTLLCLYFGCLGTLQFLLVVLKRFWHLPALVDAK